MKYTKTFLLTFENNDSSFTEVPQTVFLLKLKPYFFFMEILSNNSEYSCSVLFENFTTHMARLSTGKKGCKEIPATFVKQSQHRIKDLNSLIHAVVVRAIILMEQKQIMFVIKIWYKQTIRLKGII